MRVRFASILFATGALTLHLLAATGCARKAAEPPPATSADATAPRDHSTAPSSPPTTTSDVAEDFAAAYYGYDSYVLSEAARAALDRNAALLRQQPDTQITIEGHCDERGTVEYNQALGERRAQVAREYLTAAGISGDRIKVVSYGKERPFDQGQNEAAWASNRRAHFVVR